MTDNTTHADKILDAIAEAERLVPHAVSNAQIMSQELNRKRLLAALSGPVTQGAEQGQALLRTCDPILPATPLVFGLTECLTQGRTATADCERCTGHGVLSTLPTHRPGVHRLKVGLGASVVLFHVCGGCRDDLNASYIEPPLVWDF